MSHSFGGGVVTADTPGPAPFGMNTVNLHRVGEAIRLRGIDYNFCKGCMKCIDACPTDALINEWEAEGYADANRVPFFPHLEGLSAEVSPGGC